METKTKWLGKKWLELMLADHQRRAPREPWYNKTGGILDFMVKDVPHYVDHRSHPNGTDKPGFEIVRDMEVQSELFQERQMQLKFIGVRSK